MTAPLRHAPVTPYWRPYSDYTDEALQDRWQEVFDPENARGEAVLCHYAVTSQERERADNPTLSEWAEWKDFLGIEVVDLNRTRWFSREDLVRLRVTNGHELDGWLDQ